MQIDATGGKKGRRGRKARAQATGTSRELAEVKEKDQESQVFPTRAATVSTKVTERHNVGRRKEMRQIMDRRFQPKAVVDQSSSNTAGQHNQQHRHCWHP